MKYALLTFSCSAQLLSSRAVLCRSLPTSLEEAVLLWPERWGFGSVVIKLRFTLFSASKAKERSPLQCISRKKNNNLFAWIFLQ